MQRNTRLQTTDNTGAADLQMEGEITNYSLSPQAVGADAYASQTRLTISVRVRYTDNRDDSKDIDQTFSAYRDFLHRKCSPTSRTSCARKSPTNW